MRKLTIILLVVLFAACKDSNEKKVSDTTTNEIATIIPIPPKISVEDFMKNSEERTFRISPDGKHISYLAPFNKRMNIHVKSVDSESITRVTSVEDRDIAAALHFIREHACHGLTVDEVVRHNPVSRSTLERQVRKYLGRTPQEEIRHVQVTRVQELLLSTDLSAERIAVLCGFEHPEYLHVVFKRVTGMTPGEFRRKAKP